MPRRPSPLAKSFDPDASNTLSKVSERVQWLCGSKVTVRMTYFASADAESTMFNAVFEDVLPLGREYFFVFNISGCRRLVRTSNVVEIAQFGAIEQLEEPAP